MKKIPAGRALLPGLLALAAVQVHADFDQIRERQQSLFAKSGADVSMAKMVRTAADSSAAKSSTSLADAGKDSLPTAVIRAPYMTIVDEAIFPGATIFRYPYPATPPPGMTDRESYSGKSSMQLILTPKSWSGMSVCWGGGRDMESIREKGAIEMYVKGSAQGWGPFEVGLMDDGLYSGGRQLRAYTNASSFGKVTKDGWVRMLIPLKSLGMEGSYWDDGLNAKVQNLFNWKAVSCFTLDAADNSLPAFVLYFDKVRIIADATKH